MDKEQYQTTISKANYPIYQRRESFLYKNELNVDPSIRSNSRTSSITSETGLLEEAFVTPFAQILSSLKNVRDNLMLLTNQPSAKTLKKLSAASCGVRRKISHVPPPSSPEEMGKLACETVDELDWCLEQLESIQTGRSVSELAESKFQKLLSNELSTLEKSKIGLQISRYIFDTFTAAAFDEKLAKLTAESSNKEGGDAATSGSTAEPIEDYSPRSVGSRSTLDRSCSEPPVSPSASPATAQKTSGGGVMAAVSRLYNRSRSKHRLLPAATSGAVVATAVPPSSVVARFGIETDKPEILQQCLETVNNWAIDVFSIEKITKGRCLVAIVYALFKERNLLTKFHLDPNIVIHYLCRLEDKYGPHSYHNSVHAADVAQSIHVLLNTATLHNVFTDLEIMAAIFAGAVHDVDHPGVTNQFLVSTGADLAILYNDESVLEQHHLATAFKLLREPDCNFLAPVCKKYRINFRRIVIDMVMATDMSKHMALLADFKTTVETKRLAGGATSTFFLDNYDERIKILRNMIHLCDLSNPTKPLPLYTQWTTRITEEFWKQGDRERELGLEVSPICDRNNSDVAKSQVGFINFIVHPLWETWAEFVFPDAQSLMEQICTNRAHYDHGGDQTTETNSSQAESSAN